MKMRDRRGWEIRSSSVNIVLVHNCAKESEGDWAP